MSAQEEHDPRTDDLFHQLSGMPGFDTQEPRMVNEQLSQFGINFLVDVGAGGWTSLQRLAFAAHQVQHELAAANDSAENVTGFCITIGLAGETSDSIIFNVTGPLAWAAPLTKILKADELLDPEQ